jgi:hypothetical protein
MHAIIRNTNTRAYTCMSLHNTIAHTLHKRVFNSCEQAVYCTHLSAWCGQVLQQVLRYLRAYEFRRRLYTHACETDNTAHVCGSRCVISYTQGQALPVLCSSIPGALVPACQLRLSFCFLQDFYHHFTFRGEPRTGSTSLWRKLCCCIPKVCMRYGGALWRCLRCACRYIPPPTHLARNHMVSVKWVLLQLLSWKYFTLRAATAS